MSRYFLAVAFSVCSILAASTTAMAESGSPSVQSGLGQAIGHGIAASVSAGNAMSCGIAAAASRPSPMQTVCRPASGPMGPILFDGSFRTFKNYC